MAITAKPSPATGPSQIDRLSASIAGTFSKLGGKLIEYTISNIGVPGASGLIKTLDWITHPQEEMKKWFSQETGIPVSGNPYVLAGKTASIVGTGVARVIVKSQYAAAPEVIQAILVVDRTKEFETLGRNVFKYAFNKGWQYLVDGEIASIPAKVINILTLGKADIGAYDKIYYLPPSSYDRQGKLIKKARNYGAPDFYVYKVPRSQRLREQYKDLLDQQNIARSGAQAALQAGDRAEYDRLMGEYRALRSQAQFLPLKAGLSDWTLRIQSLWPGKLITGGWLSDFGYETRFDTSAGFRSSWQQQGGYVHDDQGNLLHQKAITRIDTQGPIPQKNVINGWIVTSNKTGRGAALARFASDFLSVRGVLEAVLTGDNLRKWAFKEWNSNSPNPGADPAIRNMRSRYGHRVETIRERAKFQVRGGRVVRISNPAVLAYRHLEMRAGIGAKVAFALEKVRQALPAVLLVAGAVTANPILIGAGVLKINETFRLFEEFKYLGWVYDQVTLDFVKADASILGSVSRVIYLATHPIQIDRDFFNLVGNQGSLQKFIQKVNPITGKIEVFGWFGSTRLYQWYRRVKLSLTSRVGNPLSNFYTKTFLPAWDNSRLGRFFGDIVWPAIQNIYIIQLLQKSFIARGIFGSVGAILGIAAVPFVGLLGVIQNIRDALQSFIRDTIIGQFANAVWLVAVRVPLSLLVKPAFALIFAKLGTAIHALGTGLNIVWLQKLGAFFQNLGGALFNGLTNDALYQFFVTLFTRGIGAAAQALASAVATNLSGTFVAQGLSTLWTAILVPIGATVGSAVGGVASATAAALGVSGGVLAVIVILVIIAVILLVAIIALVFIVIILPIMSMYTLSTRFDSPPVGDYLVIEKSVVSPKPLYAPGDVIQYQIKYKVLQAMNDPITMQDYFLVSGKNAAGADVYYFDPTSISCDDPSGGGAVVQDNNPTGPVGTWYKWEASYPNPDPGFDVSNWKLIGCTAKVDTRYTSGLLINQAIVVGYMKGASAGANTSVSARLFLNTGGDVPSGWPVTSAYITQGPNSPLPYSHSRPINKQAIDFAGNGGANLGSPIYSTSNGIVFGAQSDGSLGVCGSALFGNCVIIQSGDFKTIYSHMLSIASGIKAGAVVTRGQQVGSVGSSGTGFPPQIHLHYGFVTSTGKILDTPYIPFHVPGCVEIYNSTDPNLGCKKMLNDLGYPNPF